MSSPTSDSAQVTLSVRVSKDTADGIRAVADKHYRPVAAEIRRLIEDHIATEMEAAA